MLRYINRTIIRCVCAYLATVAIFASTLNQHVAAATTPDFLVTPAIVNLTVDPGKSAAGKVTLVNSSNIDRVMKVRLRSFNNGDDTGKPQLDDSLVTPLHEWLKYTDGEFTLAAKQHIDFAFTIDVPASAGPGSYRTALLFTDVTPTPDGGTSTISAELGPLLFVKITGEAKEVAAITSFRTKDQINFKLPAEFAVSLNNSGNVDLIPIGTINIVPKLALDMNQNNFNFNPTFGRILASTDRNYTTSWNPEAFHLGYYEAEVVLAYGANNTIITGKTTFWIIPWQVLAGTAAVLLVIIFLIYRRKNVYNEKLTTDYATPQTN